MKKGFTLIELITVIIIVAILAALALPQYVRTIERGHVTTAKSALDSIRKAEGMYHALTSTYVDCASFVSGSCPDMQTEVQELSAIETPGEWTYTVGNSTTSTFTASATRIRGNFMTAGTNIITVDENGTIAGTHPLR